MSILQIYKRPALDVMREAITDKTDERRRSLIGKRLRLYRDRNAEVMRGEIERLFARGAENRRDRVRAFSGLGSCLAIFRRIVNEVAAPLYNPGPLRSVVVGDEADEEAQRRYNALAASIKLDERMDLAARLAVACNDVHLHPRYVERLGRFVLDVLTPDQVVVLPDPDDATVAAGVAYGTTVVEGGKKVPGWVIWDDQVAVRFAPKGSSPPVSVSGEEHPGVLPFVHVSATKRTTGEGYWDSTTGDDLVAAQAAVNYLMTSTLRLHHTQGHQQIGINGDPAAFPKGQLLDAENPILAGEGNTITSIYQPTSPDGALRTIEHVVTSTAANYGLSRERINATADARGREDAPLLFERRQEMLEVMWRAELAVFELLKALARGTEWELPEDAKLEVTYAEVTAKVDRKTQLEVRRIERSLGYRSVLDDLLEDNPEFNGDRTRAQKYAHERMQEEAWYIAHRRAMGISGEADAHEPGLSQAQNGALGPLVRDGVVSRDEAAQLVTGGPKKELDNASE